MRTLKIYEILLILGGAAGAIAAIYKIIAYIIKLIKKCIHFFTDMRKDLDTVKEHCFENYMGNLQLKIMSEEMPIGERLKAGEKYTSLGGNGEVKAKYKLLQEEYAKEVRHE